MSKQSRKDWEKQLEKDFCHQLDLKGGYRIFKDSDISVDKDLCIHWEMLEEFLRNTQLQTLNNIKSEFHTQWKQELGKKFEQAFQEKPLFQLLKDGISINTHHLDLVYFKPVTTNNPEAQKKYGKNVFSAITQYHFTSSANPRGTEDDRQSIDIVLCLNGFTIITIELKHTLAGQDVNDAVKQYCSRDTQRPVFYRAFVHFAADDAKAKIATTFSKPPTKDDFREFNTGLVNIKPNDEDYAIHYLYDEILLPDSVLNFIERYLYGNKDGWIFPRYHQQRSVKRVAEDITTHFKKKKSLNLRYLIQHSAGSGKSNTIVWLVQNLRNLHVDNQKVFTHIIVLTHRLNLDDQISKDFIKAIDQTGVVGYADDADKLKKELSKETPVIVTILHRFKYLKELGDQTGKRICFIIDEAHTTQEGKLHDKMVDIFDEHGNKQQVKVEEAEIVDEQEDVIEEIGRKEFPTLCFIALTATPSDKTLEHFGRWSDHLKWEAFDWYTMDEAIAEGYILDVAKHIITYETLYELNYKLPEDDTQNEYPTLQVYRALKLKAFEDDNVIREKSKIIVQIFKDKTVSKIKNRAKAMVVTSSRLSAVKYKLFIDEELKRRNLGKWKTLVAFSGTVQYNSKAYSEPEMNRSNNPQSLITEDCFKADDMRILIVAGKFQVGFNQPLLHTMFLDKALADRNAVQTISRLNRIFPGKKDTLTVDFTNSYDAIIKAFKKYQKTVDSHKEANPDDLYKIKDDLLKRGVFTLADVDECVRLFNSNSPSDTAPLTALLTKVKAIFDAKLDGEKKREVRALLARYVSLFSYIKSLFRLRTRDQAIVHFNIFASLLYKKLDPTMSAEDLEKEIAQVKVKSHDISLVSENIHEPDDDGGGESGGGETGGGRQNGSPTSVRPLATVEEVVVAINLRFRDKVSPGALDVVESYMKSLHQQADLRSTIINNIHQDEKQVYDLVIKSIMDKLYTDYIINASPDHYGELTQQNVQSLINQSAYRMLKEVLRSNQSTS
jgi:type I restriction enzyme, R subunit